MNPTNRSRRVFVLLLSLLGTAALFISFVDDVSPWKAVSRYKFFGEIFLLGAPFFLSIPILAWHARRLIVGRLTIGEIAVAYALSTAAMLPITVLLGMATFRLVQEPPGSVFRSVIDIALFISLWLLLIANVLLLMRNLRAKASREATAEAFLLGGYLPNAIFCLVLPAGHLLGMGDWCVSNRGRFRRLRRGHGFAVARETDRHAELIRNAHVNGS